MRKLVAVQNLTLDGVMQAPGREDEDTRGGFQHGGWAGPYNDAVKGRIMGEGMSNAGELLFGRRTYEDFFSVWPKRTNNPYTEVLDNTMKYVASRTLKTPLPWQNSTLLEGNAVDAIARLKQAPGKDLVIMGSGELFGELQRRDMIDEMTLCIHPLVLGSGRRLFTDGGSFSKFQLVRSEPTTTGVIIAIYHLADAASSQPA
jgi:dihydrofolate reductase